MARYSLRPRAREDLDSIGDYTFERWGERQEEIYLGLIHEALSSLGDDPDRGRGADDLVPGLRKVKAGRHLIFYFHSDSGIDVVRILHQSMDFERHI